MLTMKVLTVSVLVCAVMALTTTAGKSHLVKRSASCTDEWSEINGRHFHYVTRLLTWARAEKNCQAMGGNLVSIQHDKEYEAIQKLVKLHSQTNEFKEVWIGGSDAQEENTWFWSDGETFSYENWCSGEPNNGKRRGQHCIQMNHGAGKCWDDDFCNKKKPSVCVKRT